MTTKVIGIIIITDGGQLKNSKCLLSAFGYFSNYAPSSRITTLNINNCNMNVYNYVPLIIML